jgi:hypothetical protein
MKWLYLLMLAWIITGCTAAATPTPTPLIPVHASSATQPWLMDMYPCAEKYGVALEMVDPAAADITLGLGDSVDLSTPAYQLGNDEILIVTQPQTGVGSLTIDQVRAIYSGQYTNWNEVGGSNLSIEVWTFASGEDIRQIFDQEVLKGLQVLPSARVAVSAQQMSDNVGTNPGAIGFLPRRWKAGNTHETLLLTTTQVMAYTKSEPKDNLEKVLACLQK